MEKVGADVGRAEGAGCRGYIKSVRPRDQVHQLFNGTVSLMRMIWETGDWGEVPTHEVKDKAMRTSET